MDTNNELEYKYKCSKDISIDKIVPFLNNGGWQTLLNKEGEQAGWHSETKDMFFDTIDKQLLNMDGASLRMRKTVSFNGRENPPDSKYARPDMKLKTPRTDQTEISSRDTGGIRFDKSQVTMEEATEKAQELFNARGLTGQVVPSLKMTQAGRAHYFRKGAHVYGAMIATRKYSTFCGKEVDDIGLEVEQAGMFDETGKIKSFGIDPATSRELIREIHQLLISSGLDIESTLKSSYQIGHELLERESLKQKGDDPDDLK